MDTEIQNKKTKECLLNILDNSNIYQRSCFKNGKTFIVFIIEENDTSFSIQHFILFNDKIEHKQIFNGELGKAIEEFENQNKLLLEIPSTEQLLSIKEIKKIFLKDIIQQTTDQESLRTHLKSMKIPNKPLDFSYFHTDKNSNSTYLATEYIVLKLYVSAKLKIKEIADKLDISANTIYQWIQNETQPSYENFIKLKKLYNKHFNPTIPIENTIAINTTPQEQPIEPTHHKKNSILFKRKVPPKPNDFSFNNNLNGQISEYIITCLIIEHNTSMKQITSRLNVSMGTISQWLNKKIIPNFENFSRLISLYNEITNYKPKEVITQPKVQHITNKTILETIYKYIDLFYQSNKTEFEQIITIIKKQLSQLKQSPISKLQEFKIFTNRLETLISTSQTTQDDEKLILINLTKNKLEQLIKLTDEKY
jgi:transcriptional regulator with XRE-family HTH domain